MAGDGSGQPLDSPLALVRVGGVHRYPEAAAEPAVPHLLRHLDQPCNRCPRRVVGPHQQTRGGARRQWSRNLKFTGLTQNLSQL
jgi:hypothetical protein